MGQRVPFPPGLKQNEFDKAVTDLLKHTARVRLGMAVILTLGVLVIAFMLAWMALH